MEKSFVSVDGVRWTQLKQELSFKALQGAVFAQDRFTVVRAYGTVLQLAERCFVAPDLAH
jgi:hypothetical protein